MTAVDTMESALEVTHGVEPLGKLLDLLDACAEQWAEGAALYGPGGTFDHLRKTKLSVTALRIRDEKQAKGEKITEASIDQLAHADGEYIGWLDGQTTARAEWLSLDAYRQQVWARINRGQAMIRVAAMERGQ